MIERCLKEIDIYGILKLSVHAGHQREKGPFWLPHPGRWIKYKSGQKILPILKMAARRLFDC